MWIVMNQYAMNIQQQFINLRVVHSYFNNFKFKFYFVRKLVYLVQKQDY